MMEYYATRNDLRRKKQLATANERINENREAHESRICECHSRGEAETAPVIVRNELLDSNFNCCWTRTCRFDRHDIVLFRV